MSMGGKKRLLLGIYVVSLAVHMRQLCFQQTWAEIGEICGAAYEADTVKR